MLMTEAYMNIFQQLATKLYNNRRVKTTTVSAYVTSCIVSMHGVISYCSWLKVSGAFSPCSILKGL